MPRNDRPLQPFWRLLPLIFSRFLSCLSFSHTFFFFGLSAAAPNGLVPFTAATQNALSLSAERKKTHYNPLKVHKQMNEACRHFFYGLPMMRAAHEQEEQKIYLKKFSEYFFFFFFSKKMLTSKGAPELTTCRPRRLVIERQRAHQSGPYLPIGRWDAEQNWRRLPMLEHSSTRWRPGSTSNSLDTT